MGQGVIINKLSKEIKVQGEKSRGKKYIIK